MSLIQIRYRLTLNDFMSACSYHWKALKQSSLGNFICGSIGVIGGVAVISFVPWLGITLIVVGIILMLMTAIRRMIWRKAFSQILKYQGEIAVSFSEAHIQVRSEEGESTLNWNFFSRYLETSEYLLLYTGSSSSFIPSIIPKSAFADKESFDYVMSLIANKLNRIR